MCVGMCVVIIILCRYEEVCVSGDTGHVGMKKERHGSQERWAQAHARDWSGNSENGYEWINRSSTTSFPFRYVIIMYDVTKFNKSTPNKI